VVAENLPDLVVRLFKNAFGVPPGPRSRVVRLPFSLHVIVGGHALEVFPAGPLDVLRFYQRHHASHEHDIEYVVCRAHGAGPEDFGAYGVIRLNAEEQVPLVDVKDVERKLRHSYGTLIQVPRARPLFERQYSDDLDDEDPPEGWNRVRAPEGEAVKSGRLTVAEVLDIMKKELTGPELIAWLEGAFRQTPRRGTIEHRYYLDVTAQLWLVRDHPQEGKTLYRAEASEAALRPEKPGR
jgi:hypothetical protein